MPHFSINVVKISSCYSSLWRWCTQTNSTFQWSKKLKLDSRHILKTVFDKSRGKQLQSFWSDPPTHLTQLPPDILLQTWQHSQTEPGILSCSPSPKTLLSLNLSSVNLSTSQKKLEDYEQMWTRLAMIKSLLPFQKHLVGGVPIWEKTNLDEAVWQLHFLVNWETHSFHILLCRSGCRKDNSWNSSDRPHRNYSCKYWLNRSLLRF